MTIKPGYSFIEFTNTSPDKTGKMFISDHKYKDDYQMFKRVEFTGEKMRSAKNRDGSVPEFGVGAGGAIIQYFSNCNPNETTRPTDPDDDRIDAIHKRFDYTEWRIIGDVSKDEDVEAFRAIRKEHVTRLARFEAHQEIAQGDVSFNFLEEQLQNQTFSYLTQTNLSMSGRVFGDNVLEVNLLIISFEPVVEYLRPLFGEPSSTEILKGWEMVLQRRVVRAARSTGY